MITRRAIFEGQVKPGMEAAFFAGVEQRLAPLWRAFPHALAVRLFYADECDDAQRPVLMIQEVDYPDMACLQAAITSPQRDHLTPARCRARGEAGIAGDVRRPLLPCDQRGRCIGPGGVTSWGPVR